MSVCLGAYVYLRERVFVCDLGLCQSAYVYMWAFVNVSAIICVFSSTSSCVLLCLKGCDGVCLSAWVRACVYVRKRSV